MAGYTWFPYIYNCKENLILLLLFDLFLMLTCGLSAAKLT